MKYIRLSFLVLLFAIWSRRSESLVYLQLFRDASSSLKYLGTDKVVETWPLEMGWEQIKWLWSKLLRNEQIIPETIKTALREVQREIDEEFKASAP